VFAHKTIGQIADHLDEVIRGLKRKPALIGHSLGGLLVQILAGRGLASATVAVDPAPFRGVLPLPLSALKSGWPVLGNPVNRNRAIALTFAQFRFAFANAVGEQEAKELYRTFAVPGSAVTLFHAAAANLNPWTEAKVDTRNPQRGPLLIISGLHRSRCPRNTYGSFARFFNSANARPARRPSLIAVESNSLAWSLRPASNAANQRRKRAS
jgi:non-heme chloroperoxidase